MKRKYELAKRAEQMARTRQRIVEAAVDLHTSVGPARTTISAIAGRAGVQRHTVYAHFPDERALFRACSAHWEAEHPFPDAAAWSGIDDPLRRLRRALDDLYAWYEAVGDDLALFARDAAAIPEIAAADAARLRALRDELARDLPRRARPAVGHALELGTWRSLTEQGLSRRRAVELMIGLVRAA